MLLSPDTRVFCPLCDRPLMLLMAEQVYSNVRNFKSDLKNFKPHFLIVVPRLLETIWKVDAGLLFGCGSIFY